MKLIIIIMIIIIIIKIIAIIVIIIIIILKIMISQMPSLLHQILSRMHIPSYCTVSKKARGMVGLYQQPKLWSFQQIRIVAFEHAKREQMYGDIPRLSHKTARPRLRGGGAFQNIKYIAQFKTNVLTHYSVSFGIL